MSPKILSFLSSIVVLKDGMTYFDMNTYSIKNVTTNQNNCDGNVDMSICGRPADFWPSAKTMDGMNVIPRILDNSFIREILTKENKKSYHEGE